LPGGFVEKDSGCCCGVQRFDGGGDGDANPGVGSALDLFGKTLAFVTDEQGDRAAPVYLPWRKGGLCLARFARASGHDVDACGTQLFDDGGSGVSGKDGKVEGGTGRRSQGFRRERAGGSALTGGGRDGSRSAESGSGAKDGAYIARVLHAYQYQDQRRSAPGAGAKDLVHGEGTRANQGGNALWTFGVGNTRKEAVGRVQHRNIDFGAIEVGREAGMMALARFTVEYPADGAGRTKSFFDQARAFNAYGARFGREPAAQGHAEFLEPFVVARGDAGGRGGAGCFKRRGHARE